MSISIQLHNTQLALL